MISIPSQSASDFVFPPDQLMARVAGTADRDWFRKSGRLSVTDIQQALSKVGRSLDSFDRILDFGCGCGRILFAMQRFVASEKLYGVDIDADPIQWLNANKPELQVSVNQPLPPLEFPDQFFDLVYSHSVFTHIDEAYQDAWLHELQRVTKPGAILILSVHGNHAFHHHVPIWKERGADTEAMQKRLEEFGILYSTDDDWNTIFPDFYHTTCHMPWYIYKHWSQYFKVHAYLDQGSLNFQDFVVLERTTHREVLPAPVIERSEELSALNQEVSRLRTRVAAMESSKFWQVRTQWFNFKRALGMAGNE